MQQPHRRRDDHRQDQNPGELGNAVRAADKNPQQHGPEQIKLFFDAQRPQVNSRIDFVEE